MCCGRKSSSHDLQDAVPLHTASRDRHCTDVLVLIVFLLGFAFWIYVGIFALTHADVQKLVFPTNSRGEVCGVGRHQGKANVLYFDLLRCLTLASPVAGCPTPQICVPECPLDSFSVQLEMAKNVPESRIKLRLAPFCQREPRDEDTVEDLVREGVCPSYWVRSRPILGRCLPEILPSRANNESLVNQDIFELSETNVTLAKRLGFRIDNQGLVEPSRYNPEEVVTLAKLRNATRSALHIVGAKDVFQKITSDLASSWHVIVVSLFLAGILAFLWIFGMRLFTSAIVWTSIVASFVLLALGATFCYVRYSNIRGKRPGLSLGNLFEVEITSWPGYLYDLKSTWIVLGILCTSVLVIDVVLVIFLRKRIRMAIEILKMTSKAVVQLPSVLAFPALPVLLQVLTLGLAVSGAAFLASAGTPQFRTHFEACPNLASFDCSGQNYTHNSDCHPEAFECSACPQAKCLFFRYGPSNEVIGYQIFNGIYSLWMLFFLVAFGQLVLAGVFSTWYFTLDKKRGLPRMILARQLCTVTRFHLGTAAFGSFILTLLTLVRMGLNFLDRKLKALNQNNSVVKALMMCLKCCFWCLERFIQYLNRNAYILTAIRGSNLCSGAREAFVLIIQNVLRVAVLTRVANFIILVSKMVITGASIGLAYLFMEPKFHLASDVVGDLNYSFFPILLVGLGSFVIASIFLEVYEMGVDTIFMCFLIDSEEHDGSADKPFYMSKSLLKLVNKTNQELKAASTDEPTTTPNQPQDQVETPPLSRGPQKSRQRRHEAAASPLKKKKHRKSKA